MGFGLLHKLSFCIFLVLIFALLLNTFNVSATFSWNASGNIFNFGEPLSGNGFTKISPDPSSDPGNLGAVFATGNFTDLAFQVFMEGNFSNSTFCAATPIRVFNFTLMIYIDGDEQPSTGCNLFGSPAACFPGANSRIILNGTTNNTILQFWNSTTSSFQTNASASIVTDLSLACSTAQFGKALRFYGSQRVLGISPADINESLEGGDVPIKVTTTYPNLTIIDELVPGLGFGFGSEGGGCHRYDGNRIGCENTSVNEGLDCNWKSEFNACEDDFSSIEDCTHFSGLCIDQTNCTMGTQFRPPGIWDTSNSKCREPFFGNAMPPCASECSGCFSQTSCEQTGEGSAGNCQWKTIDVVTNISGCLPANKKVCDSNNPTLCNDPSVCTSFGSNYNWSNSLGVCLFTNMTNGSVAYGSANFIEICFNGVDDNNNGNVDCSDKLCYNATLGIDAWKTAHPACGGGYNPTEFGSIIDSNFNPDAFRNEIFFRGGSNEPPVLIGMDPLNDTVNSTNSSELDIMGLGIKETDGAFGLGIATQTNRFASHCRPFNGGTSNMSQRFFYSVDSDDNTTTGCLLNYTLFAGSTSSISGVDYLYTYFVNETNGADSMIGYRCTNVSNTYTLVPFSASLSGPPGNIRSFICSFPTPVGVSGSTVLLIPKESMGKNTAASLRTPMRFAVFTGNVSSLFNSSGIFSILDALVNSYYTAGTADIKPIDCFANPSSCGTDFVRNGGKFFKNEDCLRPGDEDNNGNSDCADPVCSFVPNCRNSTTLYNASNDRVAPSILSTRAESHNDGAFVIIQTSKPTNLTFDFYSTNNSCSSTPITLYELGEPGFNFDDYKSFHGMPIFNGTVPQGNGSLVALNVTSNTTYFYKMTAYAQNSFKTVTSCLNFTSAASNVAKQVVFRPIFNPENNNLLSSLAVRLKYPNGSVVQSISANSSTNSVNISVLVNATLELRATDGSGIALVGANLAKAAELNFTSAFTVVSKNASYGYVSMNSSKWNEISQLLDVKTVEVTVPGTQNVLFHCDDDGTSNCTDVTNENGVTRLSVNTSGEYSTWRVPSTIGFSSYGSTKAVSLASSSSASTTSSGGGGGGGGVSVIAERTSASTTSGEFALTDLPDVVKDAAANKFTFNFNCVSPPCKVTAKEVVLSAVPAANADLLVSENKEILGAVQLSCTGSMSGGKATFTVSDCSNVGATVVHNNGKREDASVSCNSGSATASWNGGCSYLFVWKQSQKQAPQQSGSEQQSSSEQTVPTTQAVSDAGFIKSLKINFIVPIVLGVLVVLVILYFVFRKRH
ncbi:hypothetical protein HYU23_02210 [Candidatus Woesearchaeota archaeon]|nr:hypothetical protein [Candidatus Woesearchaeota archaeon]